MRIVSGPFEVASGEGDAAEPMSSDLGSAFELPIRVLVVSRASGHVVLILLRNSRVTVERVVRGAWVNRVVHVDVHAAIVFPVANKVASVTISWNI